MDNPVKTEVASLQSVSSGNYSQFTNDMQWFSANISKITKPTVLLCKICNRFDKSQAIRLNLVLILVRGL